MNPLQGTTPSSLTRLARSVRGALVGASSLTLAFLVPLGLVRAQECTSETGAGGGSEGSSCVEQLTCVSVDAQGTAYYDTFFGPAITGEQFAHAAVAMPPGYLTTSTDIREAIGRVTSSGVVLATDGEFRQTIGITRATGLDRGHPLTLALSYRSHEVDDWRESGDPVATVGDPFGPGWRVSWACRLVNPSTSGTTPVYRVDQNGATWRHDPPQALAAPVVVRYSAEGGVRIIYDSQLQLWFQETADRTRIEFGPHAAAGGDLVPQRMYRGAHSNPDWQIRFNYNASGDVSSIVDARGLAHTFTHTAFGSTTRVTKISTQVPATWSPNWPAIETVFEYEAVAPYRLMRVRKPAREFLEDQDRNGDYEDSEAFSGQLVTLYLYEPNSNRIAYVIDESTGLARLRLAVTYDAMQPWRVASLTEGEASSLPGQEERTQTFTYPSATRMTWTDARGVVRNYDHDASGGSSPMQWRVTRFEEIASADDPRPVSDPYYHGSMVWEYVWGCSCGRLTEVTMPSGLKHVTTYDAEGRGLVTSTGVVPVGGSVVQQVRTWTYRSWDEADHRLASRLQTYTNAMSRTGVNTFTFDPSYGGYRVDGSFDGATLFSVQEDALGRAVWSEESPYQVDGGGTGRARVGYQIGTSPNSPGYGLVGKIDQYQGAAVYSSRTATFGGLGWMLSCTDELGRVTSYTRDSVGWLRQATLPSTQSGRGGAGYGCVVAFEYDRHGQVARRNRSIHTDQGGSYGRANVVKTFVFDCFGRLWREYDDVASLAAATPIYLPTTYQYDRSDRRVQVEQPGGRTTIYLIDDHGRLYQERQKAGATTWAVNESGYHIDGQLARQIDPTGLESRIDTLDAWGRARQLHLAGERHMFLTRDLEDFITVAEYRTGPGGSQLQSTLTTTRNSFGRRLTETLSAPGLGQAKTQTYTYNGVNLPESTYDDEGRGMVYGYDGLGRMVRTTDRLLGATGNAQVFLRDAAGNVTRVTSVEQKQTGPTSYVPVSYRADIAYDAWDRLIRVDMWGSAGYVQFSRHNGYDSLGNPTWSMDGVGKQSRRAYDALGRLRVQYYDQHNTALPAIQLQTVYDDAPTDPELSAVMTRFDGVGNGTVYQYDLLGRLVERRDPGYVAGAPGKRWGYDYDLAGRLTGWIDGNGTHVEQVYDAQKRLAQRRVLALPTNGVVLSPLATHETWAYDAFDRVLSSQTFWGVYPMIQGGAMQPLVNAVDLYDGIERKTAELFAYFGLAAIKFVGYGYTKPGGGEDSSVSRAMTVSSGFTIGTTPDGTGKLSSMTLEGPGLAQQAIGDWRYEGVRTVGRSFVPGRNPATKVVVDNGYNTLRQLVSTTASRVVASPGLATGLFSLTMVRDVEGNVRQHQYGKVSGGVGDWFQLDGWDRLQEAKMGVSSFAGSFSAAGVYDSHVLYALDHAHNREVAQSESAGDVTALGYKRVDGSNEYCSVTNEGQGTVDEWVYDGNGNLLRAGDKLFVYDHLNRLSEVYLDPTWSDGLSGGDAEAMFAGGADGSASAALGGWRDRVDAARSRVGIARARARTPAWDPRPPVTASDDDAGLVAAMVGEDAPLLIAYYGYDPKNRRIGKLLGAGGGSFYSWSGWDLAEEFDTNFQPRTVFLRGNSCDEHLGYLSWNGSHWVRYGYVQSHNRSIVKVVNDQGATVEQYEYSPYGLLSAFKASGGSLGGAPTVPGQVHAFAGRQFDPETGLLYYRHRYYDPEHGRFLTPDPAGSRDVLAFGNPYAYVGGNPHQHVDPLGLYTVVFISPNLSKEGKPSEYDQAMAHAKKKCEEDPQGGEIQEDPGTGKPPTPIPSKNPEPPLPVPNTVRPIKAVAAPRIVNVVLIGHGDGQGGLRRVDKYDFTEKVFLQYIRDNAAALGSPIIVGVCWSQKTKDDGTENLCSKASKDGKGHPSWGHEGVGHLDENGTPTSDEEPNRGKPEPGPFRYDGDQPRQPAGGSGGGSPGSGGIR